MDQTQLEVAKSKNQPFLLVTDRQHPQRGLHNKLHSSLRNARIGASMETTYGSSEKTMDESFIFEWNGTEWVAVHHIERGSLKKDLPWKTKK